MSLINGHKQQIAKDSHNYFINIIFLFFYFIFTSVFFLIITWMTSLVYCQSIYLTFLSQPLNPELVSDISLAFRLVVKWSKDESFLGR